MDALPAREHPSHSMQQSDPSKGFICLTSPVCCFASFAYCDSMIGDTPVKCLSAAFVVLLVAGQAAVGDVAPGANVACKLHVAPARME